MKRNRNNLYGSTSLIFQRAFFNTHCDNPLVSFERGYYSYYRYNHEIHAQSDSSTSSTLCVVADDNVCHSTHVSREVIKRNGDVCQIEMVALDEHITVPDAP